MTNPHETRITRDPSGKKLSVTREFNPPVEKVWRAWTESSMLDQCWAPRPYKTETKSMAFTPGGRWHYSMVGPEGQRHWCKLDFEKIETQKSYTGMDGFCDENGNTVPDPPPMHWSVRFSSNGNTTTVTVDIDFNSEADLEKIVAMGFKEGFTMAHGNLDELLAQS
jgi:uncharacterized protein YndB with AHSA1/START domain